MPSVAASTTRPLRKRLKWSQRQMADYLGCDQSLVSLMEQGKRKPNGPISRLLQRLRAEEHLWKAKGRP